MRATTEKNPISTEKKTQNTEKKSHHQETKRGQKYCRTSKNEQKKNIKWQNVTYFLTIKYDT